MNDVKEIGDGEKVSGYGSISVVYVGTRRRAQCMLQTVDGLGATGCYRKSSQKTRILQNT